MVALDIYERNYLQARTQRIMFEIRDVIINLQRFQVGKFFH